MVLVLVLLDMMAMMSMLWHAVAVSMMLAMQLSMTWMLRMLVGMLVSGVVWLVGMLTCSTLPENVMLPHAAANSGTEFALRSEALLFVVWSWLGGVEAICQRTSVGSDQRQRRKCQYPVQGICARQVKRKTTSSAHPRDTVKGNFCDREQIRGKIRERLMNSHFNMA